jgi:hypothetical protein
VRRIQKITKGASMGGAKSCSGSPRVTS